MKSKIVLSVLLLWTAVAVRGQHFDYDAIAPHPRLLLPSVDEAAVKAAAEQVPALAWIQSRLFAFCDATLSEPPVERIKTGRRLLDVSRLALKRIYYLAYAYRMSGDERYYARAVREMEAVCTFEDWNPIHFLDVGEMVLGLAIGYDWLYDRLPGEMRARICRAIVEKGFAPTAIPKYGDKCYKRTNNWNQVCNAGLVYGALAIYEEFPEQCREIVEKCMESNPRAMTVYAPDGGYPEGYNDWGYGTGFEVMLIAALESALGHDGGLSASEGFLASARFMQFMTGPCGYSFNFSDAPPRAFVQVMFPWFARRTGDCSLLWNYLPGGEGPQTDFTDHRLLPTLLLYAAGVDWPSVREPVRHTWFNRGKTPVYIYRSGWNSPDDLYLGVKGGSAATSHAHMDAGSFVFDALGERWAMDLGMQNYYSLESRGIDLWSKKPESKRWEVFRIGNSSHNTLTINGCHHQIRGFAPIIDTIGSHGSHGAVIDLTEVLGEGLRCAQRTVTVERDRYLFVCDRIETGDMPVCVEWTMCTPAQAVVTGRNRIELTQNGKRMTLVADAPGCRVRMRVLSNDPPNDWDAPNPGTVRVGFETEIPAGQRRELRVRLIPRNL